jgi:hypothetical protein
MNPAEPGTDDRHHDASESSRPRPWQWVALTCAIAFVIFARSPDVLLLPSLEAEDGAYVFQHFYTARDAAEIMRFKSGYVPLIANLIAYMSVRLPTRTIPYGLAWIPFAITLAAYTRLFGASFREWIGPASTRALVCVLFALAPLGQWHLLAHTDYSIWNTFLLLILLTVTPRSPKRWRTYVGWTVANLLVWSHPLTILVAPIVAIRLVREAELRLIAAGTLLNLAVHQFLGTEPTGIFAGLSWIACVAKISNAALATITIVCGTAFRAAFGPVASAWTEVHRIAIPVAWTLFVVAGVAFTCWKSRRLRPVVALLSYFVLSVGFFSVLVRDSLVAPQLNLAPRYIYLPSLAFVLVFVLIGDFWLRRYESAARVRAVAFGVVVLWYGALNAQLGHYFVANSAATRPAEGAWSPYVQAHEENGRIIRDFFAELAEIEARTGTREGIVLVADKRNDWPIRLGPKPERRRSRATPLPSDPATQPE